MSAHIQAGVTFSSCRLVIARHGAQEQAKPNSNLQLKAQRTQQAWREGGCQPLLGPFMPPNSNDSLVAGKYIYTAETVDDARQGQAMVWRAVPAVRLALQRRK